jgi:hypothetical protein
MYLVIQVSKQSILLVRLIRLEARLDRVHPHQTRSDVLADPTSRHGPKYMRHQPRVSAYCSGVLDGQYDETSRPAWRGHVHG